VRSSRSGLLGPFPCGRRRGRPRDLVEQLRQLGGLRLHGVLGVEPLVGAIGQVDGAAITSSTSIAVSTPDPIARASRSSSSQRCAIGVRLDPEQRRCQRVMTRGLHLGSGACACNTVASPASRWQAGSCSRQIGALRGGVTADLSGVGPDLGWPPTSMRSGPDTVRHADTTPADRPRRRRSHRCASPPGELRRLHSRGVAHVHPEMRGDGHLRAGAFARPRCRPLRCRLVGQG
jgi:hypothetical protein